MSEPIFPNELPGLEWGYIRRQKWSTIKQSASSGYMVRVGAWPFPFYDYELSFSFLDSTSGSTSFAQILSLINDCFGGVKTFLFLDEDDCSALNQALDVGDGTITAFQLMRSFGSFEEPVVAPIVDGEAIIVKGQAVTTFVHVFLNGVQQDPSTYTVSDTTGVLTFNTAPAAGVAITASFYFRWRCYFAEDETEYSSLYQNAWELKKLKFTTCRV